jgi:4-amino-4-deoxy-L-arabinose transferase-like glycosyltransferase
VGISFRLFGVGVLQGRLPVMLYTLGCLGLLYAVGRQLYGKVVAGLSLCVALFASVNLHPVFIGRQAIAEMPMLFFLFCGLALWQPALAGSRKSLAGAALCWGLSITIKQHPLPFIVVMLLSSGALALFQKQRLLRTTLIALLGTLAAYALFYNLDKSLSAGLPVYGEPVQFLYSTSVFVPDPAVRSETLTRTLTLGFPVIISLGYIAYRIFRSSREGDRSPVLYARLGHFFLVASWLGWYTFLSVGWAKYYFPIGFLGTLSVAVTLADFSHNLNIRYMAQSLGGSLRHLRPSRQAFQVFLAIVFLLDGGAFTFFLVQHSLTSASDSVYQVQAYVHQNTPANAVIETYESELLFLLDRPCHFPPDHLQMLLNRRSIYGIPAEIPYNPLEADPDYLIIGPLGRTWQLYDPLLESGEFSQIFAAPGYQVFLRQR